MTKTTCIFGPPGTGKTHHLMGIAEEEAERAARVLFLSFTKAAAQEASTRTGNKKIEAGTIHSVAYRALGLIRPQVVDGNKMQEFSKVTGIPLRSKGEDAPQVGDEYLSVVTYAANRMIDLGEAYDAFNRPGRPREFENFANEYRQWKDVHGYVDFDDMLEKLIQLAPSLHKYAPPVILDEAQDCSPLLWRAFYALTANSGRVYIAGDDDQAIYEWSGADPHAMVAYAEKTDADVQVLEQSWRLPHSVHEFAHDAVLSQFSKRQLKAFKPRVGGDGEVSRWGHLHALDFKGLISSAPHKDWLILVRDRFRLMDVQRILNAELIPYRINSGYSPFDNRTACAIRACRILSMGGEPDERDQEALAYVLGTRPGDYDLVLGRDWRDVLKLSNAKIDFYESVDLMAPIRVTLSTIHQAKGREADHVIVDLELTPRVQENAALNRDAELRVMYVACTRSRESLQLCGDNLLI